MTVCTFDELLLGVEKPSRYIGTEAAFDRLAISTDGFCVTGPTAAVCALDEADERFQGRTVTLRPEPCLPEDEMGRYGGCG